MCVFARQYESHKLQIMGNVGSIVSSQVISASATPDFYFYFFLFVPPLLCKWNTKWLEYPFNPKKNENITD